MKKAALILGIVFVPIIIIILIAVFSGGGATPPPSASLIVWGTKPEEFFNGVLGKYKSKHPNISITYKQVPQEGYREAMLEAWALGSGPDVFAFPAQQTKEYQPFLFPAPDKITDYVFETVKQFGFKEETKVTKSTIAGPTPQRLKTNFIETVSNDAVAAGKIYGMPLTMETLVLFSNRDILSANQIALPASDWSTFVEQVPILTTLDTRSKIIQSGTSLGLDTNVTHAEDVLALIIMQNGGAITDATGTLAQLDQNKDLTSQAIEFYTDFANPLKPVFAWDETRDESINAFAAGTVAYYFGYPSDQEIIKDRSSGLNFEMTQIPQIIGGRTVNLANYELYGVAQSSKNQQNAWNLLNFMTSQEGATAFVNSSQETPLMRSLLDILKASTDPFLTMQAGQALTATTWYRGKSDEQAREIMKDLIHNVTANNVGIDEALRDAAQQMRLTVK